MKLWSCAAIAVLLVTLATQSAPAFESSPFDAAAKLVELERWHEALPLVNKALKDNPKDPRGHELLGEIYFGLSRFKECQASFDKSVSLGAAEYEQKVAPFRALLAYWNGDYELARGFVGKTASDHEWKSKILACLDLAGFEKKQSTHYQLFVESALAANGGMEFITSTMETAFECYSKLFPFKIEQIRSPVIVFADREAFEAFFQALLGVPAQSAHAAFYQGDLRVLVVITETRVSDVVQAGMTDSSIRSMYEMSFAQFCQMFCPGIPVWFNQGVSKYIAESEFEKGKPKFGTFRKTVPGGKHHCCYENMKFAMEKQLFLPFSSLLTIDYPEFQEIKGGRGLVNDAHAWCFVHFLLQNKQYSKGKKLLVNYFMSIREGLTRQEAYAKTFGSVDFKELEAAWLKHIAAM